MSDTVVLFAEGLFKGFAPDEIKAFLRMCQEKSCPDGTLLFKEQSEATKLYLVVSGGIDLHFEMQHRKKADTIIVSLKPGDTVGWSAVVPPHRYALSGYCRSKTTLLEIDRDTLEVLIEANYHLGYIFMRNIAVLAGERVHHVQDKLAMLLADEATTGW